MCGNDGQQLSKTLDHDCMWKRTYLILVNFGTPSRVDKFIDESEMTSNNLQVKHNCIHQSSNSVKFFCTNFADNGLYSLTCTEFHLFCTYWLYLQRTKVNCLLHNLPISHLRREEEEKWEEDTFPIA